MKLYAISDLHIHYPINREALLALPAHPEDWLILAGDIGTLVEDLHFTLSTLSTRFAQLIWVPGNHDLWTFSSEDDDMRGEAKYLHLVSICRDYGVLTPEDPYVFWPGEPQSCLLAPLFLLYDYSFRPDDILEDQALDWARKANAVFVDEQLLYPDPFPSRESWCAARCELTEKRLAEAASRATSLILINHFPLVEYPLRYLRLPPIGLWSGTRRTADWHTRFPVSVVVSGHLHMRATYYRDGVRFEEVSLGYPRDWQQAKGVEGYLRTILPPPIDVQPRDGMQWRR